MRPARTTRLATTAWATVHGVAWLVVDGQLFKEDGAPDPERAARDAVRVLFKGLRA